jgi:hypothetical protein
VLFYASNRDDWITSERVVLDNVLLGGRVVDEAEQGERVTAMCQVVYRVAADWRRRRDAARPRRRDRRSAPLATLDLSAPLVSTCSVLGRPIPDTPREWER